MLPILLLLFFAVVEGSILVLTVGGYRYAAAQGAMQDAELGNAAYADTQQSPSGPTGAVQAIQSSPGITGLAQVNGYRGETDTVEKMKARIEYDLAYLRNWSLVLDLQIILKTLVVVLKNQNAY